AASTNTNAGTSTNGNASTGTNTGTNANTDANANANTNANTNTNTNANANADANTNTNTDTNAGTVDASAASMLERLEAALARVEALADGSAIVSALERLVALHERGWLSADELAEAKRRVLREPHVDP